MLLLRCASSISARMCRSIAWRSSSSFLASSCRVASLGCCCALSSASRAAWRASSSDRALCSVWPSSMCSASCHIMILRFGNRRRRRDCGPARNRSRSGSRKPPRSPANTSGRCSSPSSASSASPRSSGCTLRLLRAAISSRAIGLWNGRSASSNVASALVPVWPSASCATSRPTTGSPAQGCAVRSGWLSAMGSFRRSARQRDGHHQRRRIGPIAQPQFGLQAGDAVVVRHLPRQPGLLPGLVPARVVAPRGHRRLIGDHRQRPGRQTAAVALHRQQPAARQVPFRLEAAVIQRAERRGAIVQRQGRLRRRRPRR